MTGSTRYLAFEDTKSTILIESDVAQTGTVPVNRAGTVEKVGESFEDLAQRIGKLIEPLKKSLQESLSDASEVSIEFGVKVSGKAGLVIAASELEGNFKIAIKWAKAKT